MRLLERLEQLYSIGGSATGVGPGANRPAGRPEGDGAHELATGWIRDAGLEVGVEADATLVGRAAERDGGGVG